MIRFRPQRRDVAILGVIFLGAFAWFWFWRANRLTGGDSDYWERQLYTRAWSYKRELIGFVPIKLTHIIMRPLAGWSHNTAIGFNSCLGGAFAAVIAWLLLRERPRPVWSWLIFMTGGFSTIFYGHIEIYALPAAWFFLHLLAVARVTENRWPVLAIPLTLSGLMAFHSFAVFILPAAIVVAAAETYRRHVDWKGWGRVALGFLPIWLMWLIAAETKFGDDALYKESFMIGRPIEVLLHPGLLLEHKRWGDKALFSVWGAGMALPLFPWTIWQARRFRFTYYALLYFLGFLGMVVLLNPVLGLDDYDLCSFPWMVAVLLAAWHLPSAPLRSVWVGLLLGGNCYLWLTRPLVFAEIGRHGRGTITYEAEPSPTLLQGLIDDERPLLPYNPGLKEGVHEVGLWFTDRPVLKRVIVLEDGEEWNVRYQGEKITVHRSGGRSK